MSSKSTNFKVISTTLEPEGSTTLRDTLMPPKTPVRRQSPEAASNISYTLTPLPFPPKIEVRTTEPSTSYFPEMIVVSTPLTKKGPNFLEVDPEDHPSAIDKCIIFESSSEDNLDASS